MDEKSPIPSGIILEGSEAMKKIKAGPVGLSERNRAQVMSGLHP